MIADLFKFKIAKQYHLPAPHFYDPRQPTPPYCFTPLNVPGHETLGQRSQSAGKEWRNMEACVVDEQDGFIVSTSHWLPNDFAKMLE